MNQNKCSVCGKGIEMWENDRHCNCDAGYDRRFFLNAILGGRRPKHGQHEFLLLKFSGNQWNESWEWDQEKLLKFDEGALLGLYQKMNGKRP